MAISDITPNTTGKDFNFYKKLTVTETSFPTVPQIVILFRGPQRLSFQLESGTSLQYSFNGNTVHGDMTTGKESAKLYFDLRMGKKIWFLSSGGAVVRVEAWHIGV